VAGRHAQRLRRRPLLGPQCEAMITGRLGLPATGGAGHEPVPQRQQANGGFDTPAAPIAWPVRPLVPLVRVRVP